MHIAAKTRIEDAKRAGVTTPAPAVIPQEQLGNTQYFRDQLLALCDAAMLDNTLSADARGKIAMIRSRVEIEL